MPKQAMYIATGLSVLLLLAVMGFGYYHRGAELERAQAETEDLRSAARSNEVRAAEFATRVEQEQARLSDLREDLKKEREQAAQAQRSLEGEMRSALESKEVTISELQGKLTVNIVDRILFNSGEADLKPEGAAVLRKVARVLESHTNRMIQVAGHTDNVPIRAGSRGRFADNWDLSTARATAAVRFLAGQAGVTPTRLAAVGYGEFHPAAPNDTPEHRAINRRIEIVVLPAALSVEPKPPAPPAAETKEPPKEPALVPDPRPLETVPPSP